MADREKVLEREQLIRAPLPRVFGFFADARNLRFPLLADFELEAREIERRRRDGEAWDGSR